MYYIFKTNIKILNNITANKPIDLKEIEPLIHLVPLFIKVLCEPSISAEQTQSSRHPFNVFSCNSFFSAIKIFISMLV